MRGAFLAIGVACYGMFFATFLYMIGFVGALPYFPRTVDLGPSAASVAAVAIDLALIAVFGVQHSVMARPAFKRS